MKPWIIIKKLESDNSRLFKEKIIGEHLDNEEFILGCREALDPMITFGVKDVPISKSEGPGLSWIDFERLLCDLQNREVTGNAAKEAIINCMNKSTTLQWNDWYRRILIKDLRCGVSEKTINKMAKEAGKEPIIPMFTCMLAHDGTKNENKMKGEVVVEYKYDGVRVIAIVKNGSATLYSRNGKLLTNFPHIEKALSRDAFEGYVFDGEVMSDDFQTLMKQVHRKSDVNTEDAYLAVFDIIKLEEFRAGKGTKTLLERKEQLRAPSLNIFPLVTVRYERMNLDTPEGQNKFSVMNKEALDNGYEGLMVKPVDSIYECKRSYAWLKIKPFIEVTLTVTEVEEGTGRNEGRLGALICEGTDDGQFIKVNVGSGLSDNDRDVFWDAKDKVIGQLVEVRADAITQNQDGSYSLRFPRFKTFRGFEVGEKL
jgi:DNA ligase-1